MIRIFRIIIFFYILLYSVLAYTQDEGGGGIVYGSEIGVLLSAPSGWMFDPKSGVSQNLHAVMYPKGSTWSNSNVIMYVNFALNTGRSLQDLINDDIVRIKKESPNIIIERAEPIAITRGPEAEVRFYKSDRWGNYECVAYAPKNNSVAIFVLSSRNQTNFQESLDSFKSMVAKSVLINVEIKK